MSPCLRPSHKSGKVAFIFAVAVALLGAGACAPSVKSLRSKTPPSQQEPTVERLPRSRSLAGAETCFNALDDNDNGLIDEGCGVAQSEVQFTLAWSDVMADLDLYVSDPDGHLAVADGTTSLGLTLSADCPKEKKDCEGQNFENAYLEEPNPAPGTYHVRVRLEALPPQASEVVATFGVRLPTGTSAHRMVFFAEGQEAFLKFEVPELEPKKKQEQKEPKVKHQALDKVGG